MHKGSSDFHSMWNKYFIYSIDISAQNVAARFGGGACVI
jgi:hypothetical protein